MLPKIRGLEVRANGDAGCQDVDASRMRASAQSSRLSRSLQNWGADSDGDGESREATGGKGVRFNLRSTFFRLEFVKRLQMS